VSNEPGRSAGLLSLASYFEESCDAKQDGEADAEKGRHKEENDYRE
jgi:hypothetical protein